MRKPVLFLDEMADMMYEQFHIKFKHKAISKTLKYMGLTRQRVYAKLKQANQLERNNFIMNIRDSVHNIEQLIYIDESNKDRKAARRSKGWGICGKRCTHWEGEFNRDIRYSFLQY